MTEQHGHEEHEQTARVMMVLRRWMGPNRTGSWKVQPPRLWPLRLL